MRLAFVLSCSVALLGAVGTASAQDWTKSKWGRDDEIGAANYMKPELVVKAAGLVKTGKTYALAKDKAYEFLFVLGQPRFKGGVQSMINPVAIR
jgi:hypothetical protein